MKTYQSKYTGAKIDELLEQVEQGGGTNYTINLETSKWSELIDVVNNNIILNIALDEITTILSYKFNNDILTIKYHDGFKFTTTLLGEGENDSIIICEDYSSQYFTIEALENNTTVYLYGEGRAGFNSSTIQVSTDNGETWSNNITSVRDREVEIASGLNAGDKILLKGLNSSHSIGGSGSSGGTIIRTNDSLFNIYGNIMSLIYGDKFIGKTEYNGTFDSLFKNSYVRSVEHLILPATLTRECYQYMFYGCTNLITAPELPATTLAETCYKYMFKGCTSLTKAPKLPATTLANSCYSQMFENCTSLETAPDLLVENFSLSYDPYADMFRGCTNLNYIKCLANYTPGSGFITSTQEGTFICAQGMASTWAQTIPSTWTITEVE